jgi:hypothetical protein
MALVAALYLALIALAGYAGLCIALGPVRRHWAEIGSLSFAGGSGLVSIFLFVISLLGFVPGRGALLVLVAITLGALAWITLQKRHLQFDWPSPPGKFTGRAVGAIGAMLVLAITLACVVQAVSVNGLAGPDTYGNWMFKAKIFATEPLQPMPRLLTDPSLSFAHQDYPLQLPMLVAGMYGAIGSEDVRAGKAILIPIYLSLAGVIYSAARRSLCRADALAITAAFAAAPVVGVYASFPIGDALLTLQYACCAALLLRWLQLENRRDLCAGAAFAAFTAFSKNEGLAVLPIIAVVALLFAVIRRDRKLLIDWLIGAAIALALLSPWLIFRHFLPRTFENYGGRFEDPAMLVQAVPRLREIAPDFFGLMVKPDAGGIWILLAICAALGWGALRQRATVLMWVLLVGHLLLYILTFMVTPWPLDVLIPWVGAKLLMHASPAAALLIALHIENALKPRTTPVDSA